MFIKPGFTIVISLISKTSLSLFLICSARIKGGFLLILPNTIATFVDKSQSNFSGGISTVIELSLCGKISLPLSLSSFISL